MSQNNNNNNHIEALLWDAADELRANSKLKASEYSVPALGLIFLCYADYRFSVAEKELTGLGTGRRKIGPADYQARGIMYLPDEARFSTLLQLPEGENIGMSSKKRRALAGPYLFDRRRISWLMGSIKK